jgi:hypothetical protein
MKKQAIKMLRKLNFWKKLKISRQNPKIILVGTIGKCLGFGYFD